VSADTEGSVSPPRKNVFLVLVPVCLNYYSAKSNHWTPCYCALPARTDTKDGEQQKEEQSIRGLRFFLCHLNNTDSCTGRPNTDH